MFEIIDAMSELVYISDINTYELLYINAPGKEEYGVGNDAMGNKCYSVLQGRDSPCPFCTNKLLSLDKIYTWEFTNLLVKRHYFLKDKLIIWKGNVARLEIAIDVTETQEEKIILRKTLDAERVMIDCIRHLHHGDDLEVTIPNILKNVGEFLEAERTYIFEIRNKKMFNTYEWCAENIVPQKETLQGLDEELINDWKKNFSKHECYIIEDLEDPKYANTVVYNILAVQNINSLVVAPLEEDGELIGYIGIDNPPKEKIGNVYVLLDTLRYFLVSSMRRENDEKKLIKLSYNDPLTGAYNRNRYIEDTQNLIGKNISVGIVYLDINGLKDINDQMGHEYGDKVIVDVSRKVETVFGNTTLYRIGGDEFVVLYRRGTKEQFNELVLELKRLFAIGPTCHAAIGHQWADTSKDLDLCISLADAMMYEDKKKYYRGTSLSNRYRHNNDDVLGLSTHKAVQQELNNGNFLIYLQPKNSFEDRSLTGAEALVRYRAPNGDVVAPGQFLPLLEELHLISLIDFYIYESVCAKIAQWEYEGKKLIPVSVNFSRHTISEINFISKLVAISDRYKIDKSCLEIEITESAESLEGFDLENFTEKMRETGFLISIDDFGVHYANLSLLTLIEFDKLKLDKSLIDDIENNVKTQSVVHALAHMCATMKIDTTIEGVETEMQFQILQSMGFKEAQGYLFSRPIPVDEFEARFYNF